MSLGNIFLSLWLVVLSQSNLCQSIRWHAPKVSEYLTWGHLGESLDIIQRVQELEGGHCFCKSQDLKFSFCW